MFLSHDALGIEKKEIKKVKPYQNYKKQHLEYKEGSVTDHLKAHSPGKTCWRHMRKWLTDYNHQRHMAHENRDDNCHSPAAVLNWQRGMQPMPELIYRAFWAIGETCVLNKAEYAKFRNFLLYGEQGLAGCETLMNIFEDTLTIEYGDYPLSKYSIEWQPDDRHLLRVGNPRLYTHPYQSPQLPLWN